MLRSASEDDRTLAFNFRMLEWTLRAVAVWQTDYNPYLPKYLRARYFISEVIDALYLLFWFLVCAHIAAFHIVSIITIDFSYDELFLTLITTSIYSIMMPLCLYLRLYEGKVRRLYDFSIRHFRKRSAAGVYYISISSCYRFANRWQFWWLVFCVLGTMHWAVYPILSQERTLPFPCWYPVDVHQSPMYELAYTFQVLGQLQVSLLFGLAGALFMVFVFMACSQLDMLCCSLTNIRQSAMILNGTYQQKLSYYQENSEVDTRGYVLQEVFREDLDNVQPTKTRSKLDQLSPSQTYLMELSSELNSVLEDCIRHHLLLLQFCKLLEDCYHPYVLLKLFQILLLLCFLAFMATVESLSLMKLINVLEYFMLTMTELYLYCFLGHILKNQGLKVGDALCTSPWHLCGSSYRRRMLIILMNAQRPLRLTAFKLTQARPPPWSSWPFHATHRRSRQKIDRVRCRWRSRSPATPSHRDKRRERQRAKRAKKTVAKSCTACWKPPETKLIEAGAKNERERKGKRSPEKQRTRGGGGSRRKKSARHENSQLLVAKLHRTNRPPLICWPKLLPRTFPAPPSKEEIADRGVLQNRVENRFYSSAVCSSSSSSSSSNAPASSLCAVSGAKKAPSGSSIDSDDLVSSNWEGGTCPAILELRLTLRSLTPRIGPQCHSDLVSCLVSCAVFVSFDTVGLGLGDLPVGDLIIQPTTSAKPARLKLVKPQTHCDARRQLDGDIEIVTVCDLCVGVWPHTSRGEASTTGSLVK
uniref:Uncharacterized protein n=1 Tax=Anopheles farauti TaxID=69004 RepID=A0A182QHX6_9DIPT